MAQRSFSRLATVRQLAISTLALALGIAAALALVSCGGGEDAKLLPGNTAAEITENLDLVKQYAEENECVGAENAVSDINSQIEGLSGVDPKLVEALKRGTARLSEVVAGCEEETEAVAPESEATTTEETEKTPPGLEKKEEKEREKEEKALEKEEEKAEKKEPPAVEKTTPEETPTTPTTPSTEGGGTDAPGGVSPAAPAAPEQGNE
jgi:hypothetical protein